MPDDTPVQNPPNQLSVLMDAIATMEGFKVPNSIPIRLNNPGDLMFAHQHNAIPHPIAGKDGKTRIYAQFPTVADGFAALKNQIKLDMDRGKTIAQFISGYAPVGDGNNPSSYIRYVMLRLHITDSTLTLTTILAGCFV